MNVEGGEVITEEEDEILDRMITVAENYFGEEFRDSEYTTVRTLYIPIAQEFENFQETSSSILNSVQINNASGEALDELVELIGISRHNPTRATGEVTFSREDEATNDITIASGTYVRTSNSHDDEERITYQTTEAVILDEGTTSVVAPIECTTLGEQGNVIAGAVDSIVDPIGGISQVENENEIVGGTEEEEDEDLRERAKEATSEGSSSTAPAIITAIGNIEEVQSVKYFKNEGGLGNMPGFELVVHGGSSDEIGETILRNLAGGDVLYSGNYGDPVEVTAELPNGQEELVEYSTPDEVVIYIEANLEIEEEYEGDEVVEDSITRYIGGALNNGSIINGELSMGDDVIYNKIKNAIMNVDGVFDITDLQVDTATPPSGQTNVNIEEFEIATTDATGNEIEITSTEI